MKEAIADKKLVAFCGLYCGSCGKYLKEKCPGCAGNEKAGWCQVRKCCLENNYLSCADCKQFEDAKDCKKLNNFISKTISLFTGSTRPENIKKIKEIGRDKFVDEMVNKK